MSDCFGSEYSNGARRFFCELDWGGVGWSMSTCNLNSQYLKSNKKWKTFLSVAILGWTELAKYRILQEEQKTNTAPFWAIYYHFETWLNTFLLFHPNYVSKCNERPLMKALKPKKGLNPSNSNHFCTRLSGPTHFWEMDGQNVHFLSIHFSKMCEAPQSCVEVIRVIRQILQGCKQKQILSIHLLKIEKKIVVANSKFLWPYNWPFWCNFFLQKV